MVHVDIVVWLLLLLLGHLTHDCRMRRGCVVLLLLLMMDNRSWLNDLLLMWLGRLVVARGSFKAYPLLSTVDVITSVVHHVATVPTCRVILLLSHLSFLPLPLSRPFGEGKLSLLVC